MVVHRVKDVLSRFGYRNYCSTLPTDREIVVAGAPIENLAKVKNGFAATVFECGVTDTHGLPVTYYLWNRTTGLNGFVNFDTVAFQ